MELRKVRSEVSENMIETKKEEINLEKVKEIYQELYSQDNPYFKNRENIPYYIVIGIKGKSFEDDLAIPITKDYLQTSLTLKKLLEEHILNKNEDTILASLQLGDIIDVDASLRQKLKKTFNELKNSLANSPLEMEIYSEPLDFGPEWQIKGHNIKQKKVNLDDFILENLMYIEINSPTEGYTNVKQYMVRLKIDSIKIREELSKTKVIVRSKEEGKFGPIETPVINYTPEKSKIMKMPVVKTRIEQRKKWLQTYSEEDLFYLIFSPIRFLRFKHMQNKLIKDYVEGGKSKPSIISDIRENALLGGVWEYKDIEYLMQIDLLVSNGIIVSTDFNYCSPPYSVLYKAIKDGVLMVGGIEHNFECPKEEEIIKDDIKEKIKKPGHFITYTCMKKMGSEGTQVLIKYQNEIRTTNRMLTCKEMDMEMVEGDMGNIDDSSSMSNEKEVNKNENKGTKMGRM